MDRLRQRLYDRLDRKEEKAKPENNGISKASAKRGLCDDCAKYNWAYLLGRFIDGFLKDGNFILEERRVDSCIQEHGIGNISNWFARVEDTSYGGSYLMSCNKVKSLVYLRSREISKVHEHTCSLCTLISEAVAMDEVQRRGSWKVHVSVVEPEDVGYNYGAIRVKLKSTDQNLQYHFALVDKAINCAPGAMLDSNQIDLSVLRQWYATEEMKGKSGARRNISGFKVLDVVTSSVVSAPADCTYIALSYVWGTTKPYRIKHADFLPKGNLTETSYAKIDRTRLPRTSRDTMAVVEELGERYLWVDSLCIVSDNGAEMESMIRAMNQIYKNATMTIIAACGKDAEAGLPGIYPGSRSIRLVTGSVENIRLVSSETHPQMQLEKSVWGSRGWVRNPSAIPSSPSLLGLIAKAYPKWGEDYLRSFSISGEQTSFEPMQRSSDG